jgi:hypothetical protein
MCKICDRYKGPVEIAEFWCGLCAKRVYTRWVPHGGLLHGDYEILGDLVFHDGCTEEYLRPLNERMQ